MTTNITLGKTEDIDRVLSLMERYHEERGIASDDSSRRRAVMPLLDGSPHGAVWLIGPTRAPLGYVLVTFGWSVEFGGTEGWVDEAYIRPSVRKRGIGTEVLHAIAVSLTAGGVRALHARLAHDDQEAQKFCKRVGFEPRNGILVMTDRL